MIYHQATRFKSADKHQRYLMMFQDWFEKESKSCFCNVMIPTINVDVVDFIHFLKTLSTTG